MKQKVFSGDKSEKMLDGENANDMSEDAMGKRFMRFMFQGGDHQADNFKSSVFESFFCL